jgi:hypothetical protein
MKRTQKNGSCNGARVHKKPRDAPSGPCVVDLLDVPCEALSLEVGAVTYPSNRFYSPLLVVNGAKTYFKMNTWLDLKYGVDARVWDKGNGTGSNGGDGGPAGSAPPETARLTVSLEPRAMEALQALDRRAEALYRTTSTDSFKWQSCVKTDKVGEGVASVKVYFKARHGALPTPATCMKIKQFDGSCVTGVGWDFLEAYLDTCDSFRGGRCKIALDMQYWQMNGSAGLTLQAFALAIAPSQELLSTLDVVDVLFPDEELA